jgi:glycolate oxidase iron-sulfur subunit
MATPGALPDLPTPDTCVQCGLCLPYCPTFRLTGNESYSPRGRLAAMSAVIHGDAPVDAEYDDALSSCLGCRACEAVCPGLVPYGAAYEVAIADLADRRPTQARKVRRWVLGRGIASTTRVMLATRIAAVAQRLHIAKILPGLARRGLTGLRRLEPGRAPWKGRVARPVGEPKGSVALLSGCVMDAWFGPVHDATVGVLVRAGYEVVAPESQTCCGALAAHDGHRAEAQALAARNVDAFADFDIVVSNSAGCTAHLKEYDHWTQTHGSLNPAVVDATEFIAQLIADGSLPRFDSARRPGPDVAMQDPCHLRHAQRITSAPRTLVAAAGCAPVEIDNRGLCCGAAGVYSVLQPSMSEDLGLQKADQVHASGARVVASANPGCEMQLRTYVDRGIRIVHPVELYWERLSAD